MKFDSFVELTRELPVIDSSTLRAFGEEPKALSVQLDRWVKTGRLIRLRRTVYLLPRRYRAKNYPLESIANLLHRPSYVSLERALSLHGLIPESVSVIQSVTTGRTAELRTPIGVFSYRHVRRDWFFGYEETPLLEGTALVATPEKALLDRFHLSRGEIGPARIEELRLQLDRLQMERLESMAQRARPRLQRAVKRLNELAEVARREEVEL